MKNSKFILAALMLTALFATACTFCVGDGCPTTDLSDLEQDAIPVDVEDSEDDADMPEVSDHTIAPEIESGRDYPAPESDTLSYVSPTLGMSFDYPSEFIYGEGSFRYWDNFTLNNSADGAVFDIHVNPDGFGPYFPDRYYTVEESADGSLEIVDVENYSYSDAPEVGEDNRTLYQFKITASNGNHYLVLFSVDGNTTKYQDAFEDFIESFTIL
jgi:hypothetical protein